VPRFTSCAEACDRRSRRNFNFVPHWAVARGIHVTVQAASSGTSAARRPWKRWPPYYKNCPFVRVIRHRTRVKDVATSNYAI